MNLISDAIDIALDGLRKFSDEDPLMYNNVGAGYFEMGWLNEARDIVDKGLMIFPDNEILINLLEEIEDARNIPDKDNDLTFMLLLILVATIKKLRLRK